MAGTALVALFGALALFWLSTRQFEVLLRLVIWIAGAALLVIAVFVGTEARDHFGLAQAIEDAWQHRTTPSDAALAHALRSNAGTVARFVPQLLDFFAVAGAILALLTLLAFSPGERLEKTLRLAIIGLIGFVGGAAAALALVAIGLGGQVKPQTFTGVVSSIGPNGEPSVHDGDTFWLGETSLRLWGIDAPELSQQCATSTNCGELSRAHLQALIVGKMIQCDQRLSVNSGRLVETFGRPLVKCWVLEGQRREDVGEAMISDGFAIRYRSDSRENFRLGCTLRPDVWRTNREARAAFETNQPLPASAATIGNCQRHPLTLPSPPDGREGSRQ